MAAPVNFSVDDVEVTDDHTDPAAVALAFSHDFVNNTFTPDVVFTTSEPLFDIPGASVMLGPGTLVENFQVLDPFTAIGDVTIGPRAFPVCHIGVLDTPNRVFQGPFLIECDGQPECQTELLLDSNQPPFGELLFNPVAGQAMPIHFFFDDPNEDILQVELVVEALPQEEILHISDYKTYRTDVSEGMEVLEMMVPALPPGDYAVIGILHDGLSLTQVFKEEFTIPKSVGRVDKSGGNRDIGSRQGTRRQ